MPSNVNDTGVSSTAATVAERPTGDWFGATVTVSNAGGVQRTVSIVGIDEIDTARGYISWVSPMARALIKAREGDTVTLHTPGGIDELELIEVRYVPLATGAAEAQTAGR